jgi:hypothetical protein
MTLALATAVAAVAAMMLFSACSSSTSVTGIKGGSAGYAINFSEQGVDPECAGDPEGCVDGSGNVLTSAGVPADIQLRYNGFSGDNLLFDLVAANPVGAGNVWRFRFLLRFDTQMFEYNYPFPSNSKLDVLDLAVNNPISTGGTRVMNLPALSPDCGSTPCVDWTDFSCRGSDYDTTIEACRQPLRTTVDLCFKRSCATELCLLPHILTTTNCYKLCCTEEAVVANCSPPIDIPRQKQDCALTTVNDIGGVTMSGLIIQIPLHLKQAISGRDFGFSFDYVTPEYRSSDVAYTPIAPAPTVAATKGTIELVP